MTVENTALGAVGAQHIEAFHTDGVVLIPGLLVDWVETIRAGIERCQREPGRYASDYVQRRAHGRFFDDFNCWPRIPEFFDTVHGSPAAGAAAVLMRSSCSQLFHDHVLVKEPGTGMPTPWHQDAAYFFVDGTQSVNIWTPLDPVEDATLRFVAGSHRWPKLMQPTKWQSAEPLNGTERFMPIPDIDGDSQRYRVLEWPMRPGDAVAFHFRTVHGARGNLTDRRRRAFSMRFVGDDARYGAREGITLPPFPNHNMRPGQRLREDWFPVLWRDGLACRTPRETAALQGAGTEAWGQVRSPTEPPAKPARNAGARLLRRLRKAARRFTRSRAP